MAACSFDLTDDAEPIHQQIGDYLLTLSNGGCYSSSVDHLIINYFGYQSEVDLAIAGICSDFELVTEYTNKVEYLYDDTISLILHTIYPI